MAAARPFGPEPTTIASKAVLPALIAPPIPASPRAPSGGCELGSCSQHRGYVRHNAEGRRVVTGAAAAGDGATGDGAPLPGAPLPGVAWDISATDRAAGRTAGT